MQLPTSKLLMGTPCTFIMVLAGCGRKEDPESTAEQANQKADVSAPGIAETKVIAQEAFSHGLPIVMKYAILIEFVLDRNSGQHEGPFNAIHNESRVLRR